MCKKLTVEDIEKLLSEIDFSEKELNEDLFEFSSGDFVVIGNKKHFEDVDKEMLNQIKKNKL